MRIKVIGGAGRMGLPFSLSLAKRGHEVWIYDIDFEATGKIKNSTMPFEGEEEGQEILKETRQKNLFLEYESFGPINPDLVVLCHPIYDAKTLLDEIKIFNVPENVPLLIRSTLPFGTGRELIDAGLEFIYIPERGIEGEMIKELDQFPQLVGHNGPVDKGFVKVVDLFHGMGIQHCPGTIEEVEMAKIMCNAWRYSSYALANCFWWICHRNELDFKRVRDSARFWYPRFDMARAGLVGGPCLEKDTSTLLSEHKLLECADAVNKAFPSFLADALHGLCIEKGVRIDSCTVGLLGAGFKAGVADTRNSKTEEVAQRLKYSGFKDVRIIDPFYPNGWKRGFEKCDAYIVCTPHEEFKSLNPGAKPFIDTWGIW